MKTIQNDYGWRVFVPDWSVFLRFFGDVQKSLTALGEKS